MVDKRPRGRPRSDNKAQRVQITLSPETLALIDAQDGPRSTLIEALILAAFG